MNRRRQQVLITIALIGITLMFAFLVLPRGIEAGFGSQGSGLSPRTIPEFAVIGILIALAFGLLTQLMGSTSGVTAPSTAATTDSTHPLRATGAALICLAFAYVGFSVLGFYLGGTLMATLLTLLLGERKIVKVVVIPILTLVLIYCIFELGFQVRLPKADLIPGVPL